MPKEPMAVFNFRAERRTMWDAMACASQLEMTISEFIRHAVQEKVASHIAGSDVEYGFRPKDPDIRTLAMLVAARRLERQIPGITAEDRDRMAQEMVYGTEPGPDRPLRPEEMVEVEELDD
jgi:hypothetical protein